MTFNDSYGFLPNWHWFDYLHDLSLLLAYIRSLHALSPILGLAFTQCFRRDIEVYF